MAYMLSTIASVLVLLKSERHAQENSTFALCPLPFALIRLDWVSFAHAVDKENIDINTTQVVEQHVTI